MANRWGSNGNNDILFFLGSKITADGNWSQEIKICLLLGTKGMTNLLLLLLSCFSRVRLCATLWTAAHQAPPSLGFSRQEYWSGVPLPSLMTNLNSILKKRDITLPKKVCLVKIMVFPVVLYGYENLTIKKAEHWRIDVFELWCWKRLLRVPWTARISNQSILKNISCEYSLEGLMLKLKLQYFGYLIQRTDSLEKALMLEKTRQAEKGMTEDEMVSLIWWTWVWANFGNWWCTGKPCVLQSMELQRVTHDWASELNCFYLLSLVVNICLNMSS